MNFNFTQEQLAIKKGIIKFAMNELNENIIDKEKDSVFPMESWKKCAKYGIQGLPFPAEYGGGEADILTTMLAMEGLGYGCKDSGLIFGINAQMWSVQMPIWKFGSDKQKGKYLRSLCTGEIIGAHGMTEPDSGSDAFSLRTTARREGNEYILNGSKMFVTNAPESDLFVIFATVDKTSGFMGITAFLVEKNFSGIEVSKPISKMGLRTSTMAEVILEDCCVPVENRIGPEGHGVKIFNNSMEWERSCILGSYIGAMERQLETCINYAKERKQFRRPIGKFQSVANKLVDMKVRMETSRLILYKVAWLKKDKGKAIMDSAIAKLFISESWVKSCLDAIQIHGGYGYTTEFEIERDLRDSIASRIYSGTSEVQRNIIAHHLGV